MKQKTRGQQLGRLTHQCCQNVITVLLCAAWLCFGVCTCVCCDVLALHLVQVVLSPQSPLETPGDGESSSYALLHTSEQPAHSIKLVQLLINLPCIITVVLTANISLSTHIIHVAVVLEIKNNVFMNLNRIEVNYSSYLAQLKCETSNKTRS